MSIWTISPGPKPLFSLLPGYQFYAYQIREDVQKEWCFSCNGSAPKKAYVWGDHQRRQKKEKIRIQYLLKHFIRLSKCSSLIYLTPIYIYKWRKVLLFFSVFLYEEGPCNGQRGLICKSGVYIFHFL